jgi:hypothetical protein
MKMANEILNSFKSNPEAWQVVDCILMNSKDPHAKFLAL